MPQNVDKFRGTESDSCAFRGQAEKFDPEAKRTNSDDRHN
jgi:hypothetical protein